MKPRKIEPTSRPPTQALLSTPSPQAQKQSPGRPSKLETRAWELFSRSATVAMRRGQRRDKFNEAVVLAEDFAAFWGERK